MTKDEIMESVRKHIREAMSHHIGERISPVTIDTIRAQVHDAFKMFVDSLFVVHRIDFHEHIDIKVTLDEADPARVNINMIPKTKTGAAILLEWQRRGNPY